MFGDVLSCRRLGEGLLACQGPQRRLTWAEVWWRDCRVLRGEQLLPFPHVPCVQIASLLVNTHPFLLYFPKNWWLDLRA